MLHIVDIAGPNADIAIGPYLLFAARLGGKFKEFPALAKYVATLKVRNMHADSVHSSMQPFCAVIVSWPSGTQNPS